MKSRIYNIIIIIVLNLFFASLLSGVVLYLFSTGMSGFYAAIIILFLIISFLPVVNYLQGIINTILIPADEAMLIQAVDSVLNIERFDEMLKETFDRVLKLMNARVGRLIFYNVEKNEFQLYYQKDKKKGAEEKVEIEGDSVLLEGINDPNDILIKGWLDPLNRSDKKLIEELERLGAEIVIPIFYQKTFMGLILIGDKKRYNEKEIRLLRIFASKIAINVQNSFYFNNVLKRKELERELELTDRIQKQFMPDSRLHYGSIKIEVYHKILSSMAREFYDIFLTEKDSGIIRLSAYHVRGDIKETSILIPGVKALFQCLARLDYSPAEATAVLGKIGTEKDVLIGDFSILHSSIKQDGSFLYCNNGYPEPFIFRNASAEFHLMKGVDNFKKESCINLESNDLLVLAGSCCHKVISENIDEFRFVIEKNSMLPLEELKMILFNKMAEDVESEKEQKNEEEGLIEDKLFILVRKEEVS